MGKSKKLEIVVECQTITTEGRIIKGQVIVDLKEPTKMRGLSLQLKGKAKCSWKDGDYTYYGKEELVNMIQYLHGEGSESYVHPSGRVIYPFDFVTSLDLPSSINGKYGYIEYFLKATIERKSYPYKETENELKILKHVDTNLEEYLGDNVRQDLKKIGCFCFPSGMLFLDANFCRSAFCPGESIMINATANNQSGRKMRGLKAQLLQVISYYSKKKSIEECRVLSSTYGPPIPRGETGTFVNQPLTIPNSAETTFHNDVIWCCYLVRITVRACYGSDLEVDIPVTISSVPFEGALGVASNETSSVAFPPAIASACIS
eukprot:gene20084-22054_t